MQARPYTIPQARFKTERDRGCMVLVRNENIRLLLEHTGMVVRGNTELPDLNFVFDAQPSICAGAC